MSGEARARGQDGEVTLLIDGDTLAFTAASAAQQVREDGWGFFQPFASRHVGEAILASMIVNLRMDFGASHIRIALSDPKENWRKEIFPKYKAYRKETFRPLLLDALKDKLREEHDAFHWAGLEADDTLGILNTEPQAYPGTRILVGNDKDYKTVPGLYHRLKDFGPDRKPRVTEVTPWEAQKFHLKQTLMGDATDGYYGCRGLGKVRAGELVDNPVLLRPMPGVITRGINKGASTTKWVSEPTQDYWAMVVSHYAKAGQSEEEALVTARLANILRHDQYDRATGAITLWTPSRLKQS